MISYSVGYCNLNRFTKHVAITVCIANYIAYNLIGQVHHATVNCHLAAGIVKVLHFECSAI